MTFSEVILPFRTQIIMATTGVSRQTVASWRSGQAYPSFANLHALAPLLRYDAKALALLIVTEAGGQRKKYRELQDAQ